MYIYVYLYMYAYIYIYICFWTVSCRIIILIDFMKAAYLSRAGVRTTVLERRNLLGGASVTEEIVPGFKFSRASYLLSLLRPQIYEDLQLKRHGLTLLPRPYLSFCPLLDGTQPGHYLLLGSDMQENQKNIAQFSRSDAQMYPDYVQTMERFVTAMDPLLDSPLPDIPGLFHRSPRKVLQALKGLRPLLKTVRTLGKDIPSFLEILTAPSAKVQIGWAAGHLFVTCVHLMSIPFSYVLLHHVMGNMTGTRGAWAYVQGGMGALSDSIAASAMEHGASVFTNSVQQIMVDDCGCAVGVALTSGEEIKSKIVLSNATAHVTYLQLTPQVRIRSALKCLRSMSFVLVILKLWTRCRIFAENEAEFHHGCTIHLNAWDMECLDLAFRDNIFHGAMSLDQLFTCRPHHSHCGAASPIRGLFLCGSGAHPGTGKHLDVMWNVRPVFSRIVQVETIQTVRVRFGMFQFTNLGSP
uniref:Amine oxidase domain-containing protein n=1 Tax=Eptatretus burgeri TaxID=7764 RepID=A0A8C4NKK6_EPTBU